MPEPNDEQVPDLTVSYRSTDREAAHRRLTQTFAEHVLRIERDRDLDFRLDVVPSQQFLMSRIRFGAAVGFEAPPMQSCYQINIPLDGSATLTQRNAQRTVRAGAGGLAMHPGAPLLLRWEEQTSQYAIKFPRAPLEAHAAKLAGLRGAESIEFDLSFDLTSSAGRALVASADFAYTELARPGGLASFPSAKRELESMFMTQLLCVVPNQLSALLNRGETSTRHAKIREVIDYIDSHPDLQLSITDLAELAGLGPRALQAGFRQVVGVSPSAYVRGIRLDRVNQDLVNGRGSVTDIAARWGFYHPGHFARHYRTRFGISPSETRRRSR
ncbi:AraC family transcriptional regulator [Nocardia sp. NPDC050378]|uniref:AraC family transcriptional regulator n=1 Tax=Nocardia sp. NPDC050378 TaxID=3155400 RepID=UPI0033E68D47